ncbi:MAG: hypothetical protein RBT69_09815 [Spirochaetia bacterium]|jgi:hypothetical protein|nr:hypothetical protein [Spirochaetia bacterium]
MVFHPKIAEFDAKLKKIFDDIDDYLEDNYGALYDLHPSRLERGKASNKSHDGLFNVGASYTAGFGSVYGKGYAIEIRMVTLEKIDPEDVQKIEDEVKNLLQKKLEEVFPERKLYVDRDLHVLKIHGDFSLGFI